MLKYVAGAALLISASVSFAQGPRPSQVSISDFKASGSGCPAGTTKSIVTNSIPGSKIADYFQIAYDAFEVHAGPDVPARETSKNCNLSMNIKYPKGYRFKFKNIQFNASAELEKGQTAVLKSYYNEPTGTRYKSESRIKGPYEGDIDDKNSSQPLFGDLSGCNGSTILNISTRIAIKGNRKLEGKIFRDIDSAMTQGYKMVWLPCN